MEAKWVRSILAVVVAGGILLGQSYAYPAVVIRLSFKDLIQMSDIVVWGYVEQSKSFLDQETGRIFTRHKIKIIKTLRGPQQSNVEVVTMGGELEQIGQLVPGEAKLSVGEEVVLCLRKGRLGFVPVGMAQGKFKVRHTDKGIILERELDELMLLSPSGKQVTDAPKSVSMDLFLKFIKAVDQDEKQGPANAPVEHKLRMVR